jgi:hypothetical protein
MHRLFPQTAKTKSPVTSKDSNIGDDIYAVKSTSSPAYYCEQIAIIMAVIDPSGDILIPDSAIA